MTPTQHPAQHRNHPLEQFHALLEPHKCDGCNAPDGFVYDFGPTLNPSVLCPECARNTALYTAAADQLEALLIPVVRAWAKHWGPVMSQVMSKHHSSPEAIVQGLGESFERVSVPALEGLKSG